MKPYLLQYASGHVDTILNEMRTYKRSLRYVRAIADFDLAFSISDAEQIKKKMAD